MAVIGAGPVGLLIARLAVLAGAAQVLRLRQVRLAPADADAWGATYAYNVDDCDPVDVVHGSDRRARRRCGDRSGLVRIIRCSKRPIWRAYGGRLVLVGIPPDDKLQLQHSVARRKGLTIMMSRRMKHTYPRAIQLATSGKVKLEELVSHRFDLSQTAQAYASNAAYEHGD